MIWILKLNLHTNMLDNFKKIILPLILISSGIILPTLSIWSFAALLKLDIFFFAIVMISVSPSLRAFLNVSFASAASMLAAELRWSELSFLSFGKLETPFLKK